MDVFPGIVRLLTHVLLLGSAPFLSRLFALSLETSDFDEETRQREANSVGWKLKTLEQFDRLTKLLSNIPAFTSLSFKYLYKEKEKSWCFIWFHSFDYQLLCVGKSLSGLPSVFLCSLAGFVIRHQPRLDFNDTPSSHTIRITIKYPLSLTDAHFDPQLAFNTLQNPAQFTTAKMERPTTPPPLPRTTRSSAQAVNASPPTPEVARKLVRNTPSSFPRC